MFGSLQKSVEQKPLKDANFPSVYVYVYICMYMDMFTRQWRQMCQNWAEFIWVVWDRK